MGKKLTLNPAPTFTAKVPVPVPGHGDVDVEFTFKYRTRDDMQAFTKRVLDAGSGLAQMEEHELVMECAQGWELADAFTEANVKTFCQMYMMGPAAVYDTYVREMAGVRGKNFDRPLR